MPNKNFDNTALGEQVLITIINSSKMFDDEQIANAIIDLSDEHKKELEDDISDVIKSYYQYKYKTWVTQPLHCINGNTKPFQLDLLHEYIAIT